jgi:hypothetical protein
MLSALTFDKTSFLLDSTNKGLTADVLTQKDTNADGKLTGTELSGLNMWRDLNENGIADTGEITTLSAQNITTLRSEDYGFHTKGNALFSSGSVIAPSKIDNTQIVPESNYRTLRDTDNSYLWASGGYYGTINWASNQVKINFNNKSDLIGTDGNDTFDAAYYASYTQYFNSDLIVNLLGGGGNDFIGGSVRNDMI